MLYYIITFMYKMIFNSKGPADGLILVGIKLTYHQKV